MEPVTGILLAGGKSSRMGSDKGLMLLNGKPMMAHVLESLVPCCTNLLVAASGEGYRRFNYPLVADVFAGCGPLGGIHAGLSQSRTDWNLVVSCDLPFVTEEFFRFLLLERSAAGAIVPVHDAAKEPLCALYHRSALPEMESLLRNKIWKLHDVLDRLEVKFIDVPAAFDAPRLFRNLNTPEDIHSLTA